MTLDQLSAVATEGECFCCGAPCEVTTTPAHDFEWKDEYGNYQRTYHHATTSYTYRTGQPVEVSDDAIERVARAIGTSLAYDIGMGVRVGSLTDDEKRKVATKAIAAMKDTQP